MVSATDPKLVQNQLTIYNIEQIWSFNLLSLLQISWAPISALILSCPEWLCAHPISSTDVIQKKKKCTTYKGGTNHLSRCTVSILTKCPISFMLFYPSLVWVFWKDKNLVNSNKNTLKKKKVYLSLEKKMMKRNSGKQYGIHGFWTSISDFP